MKRGKAFRRWLAGAPFGFAPALPVLCVFLATLALVASCGDDGSTVGSPSPDSDGSPSATQFQPTDRSPTEMQLPIRIAVTLPLFEGFARAAGGGNVEVISLIPPGADPYTYEFTDKDIEKMKGIDFFFLNGLGLDSRLQDIIEANRDESSHVIPFAPNILSPGGDGRTAEQAGDNAHLWLDPSLAYVYVEIVADELIIYDGIRKDTYDVNFGDFKARMLDFQDEIYAQLQSVPADRRKMITYHDSFEHFARKFEFGISGSLVDRPGVSTALDAVSRLAQTAQEQGVPAVFAESGYDTAPMQQVADQASAQMCTLYSDIVEATLTYEQMMRANADEIVRCLGGT